MTASQQGIELCSFRILFLFLELLISIPAIFPSADNLPNCDIAVAMEILTPKSHAEEGNFFLLTDRFYMILPNGCA